MPHSSRWRRGLLEREGWAGPRRPKSEEAANSQRSRPAGFFSGLGLEGATPDQKQGDKAVCSCQSGASCRLEPAAGRARGRTGLARGRFSKGSPLLPGVSNGQLGRGAALVSPSLQGCKDSSVTTVIASQQLHKNIMRGLQGQPRGFIWFCFLDLLNSALGKHT